MSKIWHCPRCGNINQDDKCVSCGCSKPSLDVELQQTSPQQDNKQEDNSSSPRKSIAIIVLIFVIVLVLGFVTVFIPKYHKKAKLLESLPDITSITTIEFELTTKFPNPVTVTNADESDTSNETSFSPENAMSSELSKKNEETMTQINIMPNLVGSGKDEAVSKIKSYGLTYKLVYEASNYNSKGSVISQNIPANENVSDGSEVILTIGGGKQIEVPLVLNIHIDEAKVILDNAGVKYDIKYGENEDLYKDFVYKQSTEYGQKVFEDEIVTIYVNSIGDISARIPGYYGVSVEDYTGELKRCGIPYQVLMCPTDKVLEGYVVSISGGEAGEYYTGIHLLTVYQATPVKSPEIEPVVEPSKPEENWTEKVSLGLINMYVIENCYSREMPIIGSTPINSYSSGTSVKVISLTDNMYYKLEDGSFIHSDYLDFFDENLLAQNDSSVSHREYISFPSKLPMYVVRDCFSLEDIASCMVVSDFKKKGIVNIVGLESHSGYFELDDGSYIHRSNVSLFPPI